jgi:peptidoglycan/xylan/chitin deacetylase (PgdA/CDA1 family)
MAQEDAWLLGVFKDYILSGVPKAEIKRRIWKKQTRMFLVATMSIFTGLCLVLPFMHQKEDFSPPMTGGNLAQDSEERPDDLAQEEQEPEMEEGVQESEIAPEPERPEWPAVAPPTIDPNGGVLALTFDDGPMPGTTDRLLNILGANGVRATFFVAGARVARYPDIVRRAFNEGHQIASHGMNHRNLTTLSYAEITQEVNDSFNMIWNVTGVPPTTIRPPYGVIDDRVRGAIGGSIRIVMWSVDPRDWEVRNTAVVQNRVLGEMRDGSIIILHDIYDTTVDAVQGIIYAARANNFTFVTIDEMAALGQL